MNEIRRADPRARRQALWLLAAAAAAGAAGIYALESLGRRLEELAATDPQRAAEAAVLALRILAVSLVAVSGVLTAFLYRHGLRIAEAGVYPPPGARLMRATPVVTGARAATRGRALKFAAWALFLSTLLAGILLWHLGEMFFRLPD